MSAMEDIGFILREFARMTVDSRPDLVERRAERVWKCTNPECRQTKQGFAAAARALRIAHRSVRERIGKRIRTAFVMHYIELLCAFELKLTPKSDLRKARFLGLHPIMVPEELAGQDYTRPFQHRDFTGTRAVMQLDYVFHDRNAPIESGVAAKEYAELREKLDDSGKHDSAVISLFVNFHGKSSNVWTLEIPRIVIHDMVNQNSPDGTLWGPLLDPLRTLTQKNIVDSLNAYIRADTTNQMRLRAKMTELDTQVFFQAAEDGRKIREKREIFERFPPAFMRSVMTSGDQNNEGSLDNSTENGSNQFNT